jgi:signal transduction histidine kinase
MTGFAHRVSAALEGVQISPPVIAIYAVASMIGAAISLNTSDLEPWQIVAMSIGVTLLTVIALLGARYVLGRFFAPFASSTYVAMLMVALVVGSGRGALLVLLASEWDATPPNGAMGQVANSAFSAVLWLSLASLLLAGRERYRRRYRSLLLQGAPQTGRSADLDLDSHPTMRQVKTRLTHEVERFGVNPNSADLLRVSQAIRQEIETNIRPLSHRLWFGSIAEEPQVRWSRLIRDAITGFTVPAPAVSAIWGIGSLLGGLRIFGVERALLAAGLSAIVLLGMLILGHHLVARIPWLGYPWVLSSAIIPIFTADAVLRGGGFPSDLGADSALTLLVPLALLALIVTAAAITLANSDRDAVLEIASRNRQNDSVSQQTAQRVSTFLHNSLQSELNGLALQLEAAAVNAGSPESNHALERVHALLARSLSDDFAALGDDPAARAARVTQAWRGICEVACDIDAEIENDSRLSIAVQAIEEIIANAVRHSGATKAHVQISLSGGQLLVTCHANGTKREFEFPESPGMGTHLFRTLDPQGLRVSRNGEWTVYEITIE